MKANEQTIYNQLITPISEKKLVSFIYKDVHTGKDEFKMVEPFQVGIHTTTGNAILSAWYTPMGSNANKDKEGWRIYLLSGMSNVTSYAQNFTGNRPGYKPDTNKTMKEILVSVGG